jgi:predicted dehydrogenase
MMFSRRSFLRFSAAAALGASRASAQTRKPLKLGFLGVAHSHGPGKVAVVKASSDWELIGIHEPDEAVRQGRAELGVPWIGLDELFSKAEVVAITSPVRDHTRHAKIALEAERHVHLEKPPADNYLEFASLIELAKARKRIFQQGYMWRFHPGLEAIFEAVREGRLGTPHLVECAMNNSLAPSQRPAWAEFKGGAMFELGCHLIDATVRLLGEPERVTPFLRTHGSKDQLADNTVAILDYPNAMAIIRVLNMQPNAGAHRFFEVTGTMGTARIQPMEPPELHLDLSEASGPFRKGPQKVPLRKYERYVDEFAELAAAVRGERALSVAPEQELAIQRTLMQACAM